MQVFFLFAHILLWTFSGYLIATYVARFYGRNRFILRVAGISGAVTNGLFCFFNYRVLDINNLLFAIIASLAFIYIALPENKRYETCLKIKKDLRKKFFITRFRFR